MLSAIETHCTGLDVQAMPMLPDCIFQSADHTALIKSLYPSDRIHAAGAKDVDMCYALGRVPGRNTQSSDLEVSNGVNSTEEFVFNVCRKAALSLWCYANPQAGP